jgi:mono/diheme cytochrome c family protein
MMPLSLLAAAVLATATPPAPPPMSGQALFVQRCGGCHLKGGFGTAAIARSDPGKPDLLAERHPPADLVRTVVRNGYRSMPPIRKTELDDAQLGRISAYLEGTDK